MSKKINVCKSDANTAPYGIGAKIARLIGEAISDFSMIEGGDSVLVGLSGGKDSLLLCSALARLKRRSPVRFDLTFLTIDQTNGALNTSELENFAQSLGVQFHRMLHPIYDIIAARDEGSPCSLCANLRRGILATQAQELGCNVLALGHHRDDAIETALLNLFNCGRFKCFQPSMTMSRSGIRVIRPLVYVKESTIVAEAKRLALPILDGCCPYGDDTGRSQMKSTIAGLRQNFPRLDSNILHALKNIDDTDAWRALFTQK